MSGAVRTAQEEIKYKEFVEVWEQKYLSDWCTKAQLEKLVQIGRLNQEDYERILLTKEQQHSQDEINRMM